MRDLGATLRQMSATFWERGGLSHTMDSEANELFILPSSTYPPPPPTLKKTKQRSSKEGQICEEAHCKAGLFPEQQSHRVIEPDVYSAVQSPIQGEKNKKTTTTTRHYPCCCPCCTATADGSGSPAGGERASKSPRRGGNRLLCILIMRRSHGGSLSSVPPHVIKHAAGA